MPATFHDTDTRSNLQHKRPLSYFLDALVKQHRPAVKRTKLTYVFCSDEALLQLNQQFLQHDTLTDIITFDLSETENELTGEIHISTERVADNAVKFGVPYERELHRVIFHGALHLCGFKDKSKKDAAAMRTAEDDCLAHYFQNGS